MRTGRPVAKIELSAEIAGILEGYTQRRKTAQALALRARSNRALTMLRAISMPVPVSPIVGFRLYQGLG